MAHPKLKHKRIQGDGLYLNVGVAGEGPPVVLLHGFPDNSHSWRYQIEPLVDAGFSVWAPHLRGYPPSEVSSKRRDYHLRHLVNDVAAVVSATGSSKAVIVGHDWGGVIAWAFAGSHPEMLDKLVILNAPHMQLYLEKVWRSSQALRSLYAAFFLIPVLPEKLLSANNFYLIRRIFRTIPARKNAFSEQDIDYFIAQLARPGAMKAALDYYRENLLPSAMELATSAKTDAPTLVIWGDQDPTLGRFLLDGLNRFASRLTIHHVSGASHWVHSEASEEVNRVLLDFLRTENEPPAHGLSSATFR